MKLLILILAFFCFKSGYAHSPDSTLYNPQANATADIAQAVAKARKAHKFVLIQAGGNWCIWCLRFNHFVTTDPQLDSALNAGFIFYHLNYSKENKNIPVFAHYGFPQRFGFPVFIILDGNGKRLNTQDSEYLEEGKGYSREKVLAFLRNWSPAALNPANYQDN